MHHPQGKESVLIRVLIVDDHAFVRAGLTALLGSTEGIQVVGECADGAEVPDIVPRVRPDVVQRT